MSDDGSKGAFRWALKRGSEILGGLWSPRVITSEPKGRDLPQERYQLSDRKERKTYKHAQETSFKN